MVNAIALSLVLVLAICLAAIEPAACAGILFIVLCFFVYKIFTGSCHLLLSKIDCELWEIYLAKENHFWKRPDPEEKFYDEVLYSDQNGTTQKTAQTPWAKRIWSAVKDAKIFGTRPAQDDLS